MQAVQGRKGTLIRSIPLPARTKGGGHRPAGSCQTSAILPAATTLLFAYGRGRVSSAGN